MTTILISTAITFQFIRNKLLTLPLSSSPKFLYMFNKGFWGCLRSFIKIKVVRRPLVYRFHPGLVCIDRRQCKNHIPQCQDCRMINISEQTVTQQITGSKMQPFLHFLHLMPESDGHSFQMRSHYQGQVAG